MTEIKQLGTEYYDRIKSLFYTVFTSAPWFDDWSDEKQLSAYITDLTGNPNSLSFGLFEDGRLIGLALGSIKHWCKGTEYYIDEFCILTECQGKGLGTAFMNVIEEKLREKGIVNIFLQTGADMPAHRFYNKLGFNELVGHISLSKHI